MAALHRTSYRRPGPDKQAWEFAKDLQGAGEARTSFRLFLVLIKESLPLFENSAENRAELFQVT